MFNYTHFKVIPLETYQVLRHVRELNPGLSRDRRVYLTTIRTRKKKFKDIIGPLVRDSNPETVFNNCATFTLQEWLTQAELNRRHLD